MQYLKESYMRNCVKSLPVFGLPDELSMNEAFTSKI